MQRQFLQECAALDAKLLQQQLHALEAARSKEMLAHGERVHQLQALLDASSKNGKELQLAVAKLRAEKCRVEGESASIQSKLTMRDQEILVLTQRHEKVLEDYRQRLLGKETAITNLMAANNQLRDEETMAKIKHSVENAEKESLRREKQRIEEEKATQATTLHYTNDAIATLIAQVAAQAVELQTAQRQNETYQQQLAVSQAELRESQKAIASLSRRCEKMEVTRLRLAAWKHNQLDLLREALILRDAFLEWKAQSLASNAARTKSASTACARCVEQLEHVHAQLKAKLHDAREALRTNKSWLEVQQREMMSWKSLCVAQFSTLVVDRITHAKREMMAQQVEVQAMHNEESTQLRRQLAEQMAATTKKAEDRKVTYKRRVKALVSRVDHLYRCQLRTLAFQGWKDAYLRNVIGQTTHALMVVRAARALSGDNNQVSARRKGAAAEHLRILSLEDRMGLKERQQPEQSRASGWHQKDGDESQLRRWRRVTPTDARTLAAARGRSVTSIAGSRSARFL